MANRIQSLLGVDYPVVRAPMAYIARAELAAAVSDTGGLGVIEMLTAEGRADLVRVRLGRGSYPRGHPRRRCGALSDFL